MTINRKLATFGLAAGIGALNLVTLGTAAHADGRRFDGPGRPGVHRGYAPVAPQHRDHRHGRDNIGKGIAIGIGALMLGAILASEANRHHADRDYD